MRVMGIAGWIVVGGWRCFGLGDGGVVERALVNWRGSDLTSGTKEDGDVGG